jgi:hypothetical protein
VGAALAGTGARRWQVGLIVDELTEALAEPGADVAGSTAPEVVTDE